MALRNEVKACIQISVKDKKIVGLKHVQTFPMDYVKRHYGTVKALEKSLKGTILEGGNCEVIKTHDYDSCFLV